MSARYLVRRLATSLLVLAGVIALTFFATRMLPTDPAQLYAGRRARPEQLAAIRSQLGLDQPLPVQFAHYVNDLARGDLGQSFITKRSVRSDLGLFLPATLELVVCGFFLALVAGIPLGILAGARERSRFDRGAGAAAVIGAAAPVFALALLAQQVFFSTLHWLPLNGRMDAAIVIAHPVTPITGFLLVDAAVSGNWVAWRDAAAHLVLPVFVIAIYPLAVILRMTRNSVVEALHEPHIVVARAKGMPERIVLSRHALRNALLPVLTIAGLTFAYAITGTVFVEVLFRWPGMGKYVADAILARDLPPILAVTLVSTAIFVGVTFFLDIARALLDPRTRTAR